MQIYRYLITLLFLLHSSVIYSQELKVRVANWPPISFKTDDNAWQGIDIDIMNALAKEAGHAVQYIEIDSWARSLREMESAKIDVIFSASKTENRSGYMHWIGPIRKESMRLIVSDEFKDIRIKSLDDLARLSSKSNRRFGLQYGVFYSNEFQQHYNNSSSFREAFDYTPKAELNLIRTLRGRTIGFFEDPLRFVYLRQNEPQYSKLSLHSYSIPRTAPESLVYIAISKHVPKTVYDALKKAFERLQSRSAFSSIEDKWRLKLKLDTQDSIVILNKH